MVNLRPVTAATFDVLITLSEEPRKDGFKKDHIDVSNATAGDPTFLDKIDEEAGTISAVFYEIQWARHDAVSLPCHPYAEV